MKRGPSRDLPPPAGPSTSPWLRQFAVLLAHRRRLLLRRPVHLTLLLLSSVLGAIGAYFAGRDARGPGGVDAAFPPLTECGMVEPQYLLDVKEEKREEAAAAQQAATERCLEDYGDQLPDLMNEAVERGEMDPDGEFQSKGPTTGDLDAADLDGLPLWSSDSELAVCLRDAYYSSADSYYGSSADVPATLNETWRGGLPAWLLSLGPTLAGIAAFLTLRDELQTRRWGTLKAAHPSARWLAWLTAFAVLAVVNSLLGAAAAAVVPDIHALEATSFAVVFGSLLFLNVALVAAAFLLAALCGTCTSAALTVFLIMGMVLASAAPAINASAKQPWDDLASHATETYNHLAYGGGFWLYSSTARYEVDYSWNDQTGNEEQAVKEETCELPLVSYVEGRNYKGGTEAVEMPVDEIFMVSRDGGARSGRRPRRPRGNGRGPEVEDRRGGRRVGRRRATRGRGGCSATSLCCRPCASRALKILCSRCKQQGCYIVASGANAVGDAASFFWYLLPQYHFLALWSNVAGYTSLPGNAFTLGSASKSPAALAAEALANYKTSVGTDPGYDPDDGHGTSLFPQGSTVATDVYYEYNENYYYQDDDLSDGGYESKSTCPAPEAVPGANFCRDAASECPHARRGYPTSSGGPSANDDIGRMFSLVVVYGLLAAYVVAVLPMRNGAAARPWFFLLPGYWCGGRRRSEEDEGNEGVRAEAVSKRYGKVEALKASLACCGGLGLGLCCTMLQAWADVRVP